MTENLRTFLEELQMNPDLLAAVSEMTSLYEVIELANEAGFPLEMSDFTDLEAMKQEKKALGACLCFFGGYGHNPEGYYKEYTCVCPIGGMGFSHGAEIEMYCPVASKCDDYPFGKTNSFEN